MNRPTDPPSPPIEPPDPPDKPEPFSYGENYDRHERRDLRLIERAIINGWPISDEDRALLLKLSLDAIRRNPADERVLARHAQIIARYDEINVRREAIEAGVSADTGDKITNNQQINIVTNNPAAIAAAEEFVRIAVEEKQKRKRLEDGS